MRNYPQCPTGLHFVTHLFNNGLGVCAYGGGVGWSYKLKSNPDKTEVHFIYQISLLLGVRVVCKINTCSYKTIATTKQETGKNSFIYKTMKNNCIHTSSLNSFNTDENLDKASWKRKINVCAKLLSLGSEPPCVLGWALL